MTKRPFVKAETTTVAPEKSRMEIEMMLRRYGAVGFSFSQNLVSGDATVDFIVPDSKAKDAPRIPVRIPVNCYDVYDALFGQPTVAKPGTGCSVDGKWVPTEWRPMPRPYTHDSKRVLQAERVAWRNLVLWIDAALSAATIGLRTIAETFAGDRLVTDESGQTMRVQELLDRANGALPMGGRLLLLGSGTEDQQ
jgi:hypothetical protein